MFFMTMFKTFETKILDLENLIYLVLVKYKFSTYTFVVITTY